MNSNYISLIISFIIALTIPAVSAEDKVLDILEQEKEQIQEINNLKHQARTLEERVRIANAYKKMLSTGIYVPSSGHVEVEADGALTFNNDRSANFENDAKSNPEFKSFPKDLKRAGRLPKLESISSEGAYFLTHEGPMMAQVGTILPTGHLVETISIVHGVNLTKDGQTFNVQINWDNFSAPAQPKQKSVSETSQSEQRLVFESN